MSDKDNNKLQLSLVPPDLERAAAIAMQEGNKKEGRVAGDWQENMSEQDALDSLLRHLSDLRHVGNVSSMGEDGVPSVCSIAANVSILSWHFFRNVEAGVRKERGVVVADEVVQPDEATLYETPSQSFNGRDGRNDPIEAPAFGDAGFGD